MKHAGVRETVVIAREDTAGVKRLAAYIVPLAGFAPAVNELRAFLQETLPDYMIPASFVFLESLPLTPNGKVDRKALPAPDGSRPELEEDYVAPRTLVEESLARIWRDVLGIKRVGIHDNFFELGGDSILSIQVIARAGEAGIKLTPKQIFQHQSISKLAAVADTAPAVQAEQDLVTGPVPLTPIQHWFFNQEIADRHHWNQAVLLEVREALDPVLLEQAVGQLLVHHDALRLRYTSGEAGWQQVISGPGESIPFSRIDLSGTPEEEQSAAIEKSAAELQASLDIAEGPLMRVALFDLGYSRPGRLLIVIHHLAVDGVSWRILLEDLQTIHHQLSYGETVRLPQKTTSFKQWSERLTEYAQTSELQTEQDYWLSKAGGQTSALPKDYPGGANTVESARTVAISLTEEETQALLKEVPKAYHTQINDVLLTAVAEAFNQWTGERSVLIDLEGHGREDLFSDLDLSRTVGWFTSLFPVNLALVQASGPGEALKQIKEQLRGIPNRGIGFGILRYLTHDTDVQEKLQALPQAEVSFNYLGQFDQVLSESTLLGSAHESPGPGQSMLGKRGHVLEINGMVAGGQLQIVWTYSSHIHSRRTIERLAEGFAGSLRGLIEHCLSPEAGGYTPSDFPEAEVSQRDLEKLVGRIS
jgi:non-ribosomal peptide synthase protein (TIGR01720 family)